MHFGCYGNLVSIDLKAKNEIYCYLTADILTKVVQKYSFSSPLPSMNFVQTTEFDWLQPKW